MRITAGRFKNHRLSTPKGKEVRPTTERMRETVFNILQAEIETSSFLDLFAGSGAMGIEALSRGALRVTFVEKNRTALRLIKQNLQNLALSKKEAILIPSSALEAVKKLLKEQVTFDIIYLDPPYGYLGLNPLLHCIDTSPLLTPKGNLFIEEGVQTTFAPPSLLSLSLANKRKVGSSMLYFYKKNS